jgi:limonene 1,2-monooxygenase
MRPDMKAFATHEQALDEIGNAAGASVIGTPDDLVDAIRRMREVTGGFGTVIGFAHDWANPEQTSRSWDMVARYVIPEVNGMLDGYRESQRHVIEHRGVFERAGDPIMAKINENERAVKAMSDGAAAGPAKPAPLAPHHAPDLRSVKTN